jgi:Carboxypeptidase regulatory-like domain/TonB dependent receptor
LTVHENENAEGQMTRRLIVVALVVVCSLTIITASAVAQAVYGSILGTITDPSGAAVAGAKVTVTSVSKGITVSTTTNADGNYSVTHLIPDVYNVKAEASGFKSFQTANVVVSADTGSRVDGQFQVGGSQETVEVTAEAPQLKTDRADVAVIFNDKAVEDLPLFNRNFTQLVLASPGTQQQSWNHAASENPQGSLQTKVNGQTFAGTGFQLDGTDNRDPILGIIVINPTLESVTEAKMTSQNYDAEFGQAISGVVASQTKSGSNSFHGSAFGFRRSDATQARDPFSQSKVNPLTGRFIPPTLFGQYGGSIGGPIKKDKLFFFGDYQATRSKLGSSYRQSIPSALIRSTCDPATSAICDLSEYLALSPTNQAYDPTTGAADGSGRTPFGPLTIGSQVCTGNCIPTSRLSSQAVALLQQFPAPNGSGIINNFTASGNGIFNSDQFNIRVDDQTTSKLHTFGRYSFANYSQSADAVFGALGGIGFGQSGLAGIPKSRDQSIASGFDYALGSTLLTDFRFGYVRYHVNVSPNGLGTNPATAVGIPGLNLNPLSSDQPAYFVGSSGGDGQDTGAISSSGGISNFGNGLGVNRCNCPLIEQEDQFQFVNNWTKIVGNHQAKFGADIRFARNLRVPSDKHRAGELSFAKSRTADAVAGGGVGMATFLLGDVTTFNRYVSTSSNAAERQKRFYFYGQDTWRATSKLTIAYGLRWDIVNPEYVNGKENGGFLDLNTGNLRVAGVGGIGTNFNVERNWNNFAPRLGIAYQVTPKTVLRLGYGRSYDIGVFGSIYGHSVTQNLPVLASQSLNSPTSFADVFTLTNGPPAAVFPAVPSDGLLPEPVGVSSHARPNRMRLARADAYNLTLQHQVTRTVSAEIAYVGNQGHGFYQNNPDMNINQASIVGFPTLTTDQRRPFFGRYGWTQDIIFLGNNAANYYNSLQTKIDKRFSDGLQFVAHYTWSKSLDHDRDYFAIDPRVNYGRDDFNRTHVFSFSTVYELPFGKGKRFLGNSSRVVDLLIGGFQLNTTTNWSSGLPWSPTYNECSADEDTGPCRPIVLGSLSTSVGHFDPVAGSVPFYSPVATLATNGATNGPFQRPQVAHFGSQRNPFTGPRFFNSNFSLFKNFAITERFNGQFRFEAFNVFNNVNLNNPNNCVDCGSGGLITSLAPNATMRQLNFGVKFTF